MHPHKSNITNKLSLLKNIWKLSRMVSSPKSAIFQKQGFCGLENDFFHEKAHPTYHFFEPFNLFLFPYWKRILINQKSFDSYIVFSANFELGTYGIFTYFQLLSYLDGIIFHGIKPVILTFIWVLVENRFSISSNQMRKNMNTRFNRTEQPIQI